MFGWQTMEQVTRQRVVGIVRTADASSGIRAAETLLGAGLLSVEVTLTNPAALEAISSLAADHPDAMFGAGSVLDGPSAGAAIRAGARFLVSPTLSTETIRAGLRYGVPTVAGTSSPTEMLTAIEAGAAAVKLFPASNYTPRWISDVRAALPQLPIVPTGGGDAGGCPGVARRRRGRGRTRIGADERRPSRGPAAPAHPAGRTGRRLIDLAAG